MSAAETSFITVSRSGADLAWRRALALALAAGTVRRLRHDANLSGDPASLRHRPIYIVARAVWTLDPAKRRQIEVHAGMAEGPAAAIAGRHHFADLDLLERGHCLANGSVAPIGVSP